MKFRSSSKNSAPAASQGGDLVDGVTIKWLQYAGLQHLASPSPDRQQLLHDLLLQSYGGFAIPGNESFEYSSAQLNPLNSSGEGSKSGSVWIGNGLLDLKSTHHDTNFLCEDLTTEPLDLLSTSPPKVVSHDFSSTVCEKSPVKPNNTTRVTIAKQKSEENGKGKEAHKEIADKVPLELSSFTSLDRLNDSDSVLADKKMGKHAKDENMAVAESVDVVALQIASPEWSPTRGLYSESNLVERPNYGRSTGKHDDDFTFIRYKESSKNSDGNKRALCKMENISKKSPSMDCITLDNAMPESTTTEMDNRLNPSMEDLHKLHLLRTASASEENNFPQTTDKGVIVEVSYPETLSPSEINKKLNSAIEELAKSQSTRKARSLSSQRKEASSKETNPTRVRVLEKETEELDLLQHQFHHSSNNNASNSEREEKPKRPLSSKHRTSSCQRGVVNSKGNKPIKNRSEEVKAELNDSTHSSSPRKFESKTRASSVHWKETKPKEAYSDKPRVVGEENKLISARTLKKEPIARSKSKDYNSKRASIDRIAINPKDNRITNFEPVKIANEQFFNPVSISREEVTSTKGIYVRSKEKNAAKIKVVVRKRPLNKKEIHKKEKDILSVEDGKHLTINEPRVKVDLTAYIEKHEFHFDVVLHEHATNDEVYNVTVGPSIQKILEQTKLTCFTFGHTGSGKSFTMGNLSLRASRDILQLLQKTPQTIRNLTLWISYFEICGKTIFDLLNARRKLCIREDGNQQVCIVGLQESEISDMETVEKLVNKGNDARSKGSTGANEESSRSHSVLWLTIKQNPLLTANGTQRKSKSGELKTKGGKVIGKISFIYLAGSERGADRSDNDHDTRKGVEINKSLLALKECICALDNDQNHIPFHGSKLTEVLRDSFMGDATTVMICCLSPSASSCEQTLNSLRYAERVKNLCKDGYSQKDQSASEILTDSEKMDQSTEKIIKEGENNRKLYNPEPEITENLSMTDVCNCTPTIGETSFRFMPNCGITGSEELALHEEYKTRNYANSYSTSSVSGLDFGTQNKNQIYGNEEEIVQHTDLGDLNIEKDTQALVKDESNHSSISYPTKEHTHGTEIVDKVVSFYQSSDSYEQQNYSIMPALLSSSLDLHQKELVEIEPLTKESYENENHWDLVHSGLHLQNNEETSWNHKNQEDVSSDNGNIKTIFEVYSPRNSAIDEGEEAIKETGQQQRVMDVSLNTRAKPIERELLLPLDTESKDLEIILSNNPTATRSDASTHSPLNVSEIRKASNKLPNGRITMKGDNENRKNLSKEESMTSPENHKEQFVLGLKANHELIKGKRAINLFEEEEALLATHRKVVQNTMNILCEEINLLVQVDQPGSLNTRYVAELSSVLSRKAADLASLKEHVIRFQHLQD